MRGPFVGALVVGSLCALAVLIALGSWQVRRLHWKEGLLATIEERVGSQPRSLADIQARLTATGDIEYFPVTADGVFHHEGERHFFSTYEGMSGYFVYTPLKLDNGRFVFVNRGFVPFDRKDPGTREEGQVDGRVSVTGLAREPAEEKPSFVVPENDPAQNIFYWKDLSAMAETSGVGSPDEFLPFFIDANDAPNPGGLPVGGVTYIDLPNNHLQYAITWYGLAAALCGVLGVWLWRWRRQGQPDRTAPEA